MQNFSIKRLMMMMGFIGIFSVSGTANAVPLTADISISNSFTVVHLGGNPGGAGDPADWLWFDAGQTIDLDLSANILSLDGLQSYSLTSSNGAMATMDITGLTMDLNDSDGFFGGSLDYLLDGVAGSFSFANQNYGNSVFNSSSFNAGMFNLYAWGGDEINDIGIDFGISATVPEPATWVLMLAGLIGIGAAKRRYN